MTAEVSIKEAIRAKPVVGIIHPPPEIRSIVDKTANFVARIGPDFESRILQAERDNRKFSFLNESDPYHSYYRYKIKEFAEGRATETTNLRPGVQPSVARAPELVTSKVVSKSSQETFIPKDPPAEFEFSFDPPSINAQDLDIVRLTAQFVARNGRQFLSQLMNREARNYQFDFLRPQHCLFQYFTKLVEQYTKILIPPKDLANKLDQELQSPRDILKSVRYRVEWSKYQDRQKKKEEEALERERMSYAQIDWHDFVVVETVDYPPNEVGDFPPPTLPEEVGARSIAQARGDDIGQFRTRVNTNAQPMEEREYNPELDVDVDVDIDGEPGSEEDEESALLEKINQKMTAAAIEKSAAPQKQHEPGTGDDAPPVGSGPSIVTENFVDVEMEVVTRTEVPHPPVHQQPVAPLAFVIPAPPISAPMLPPSQALPPSLLGGVPIRRDYDPKAKRVVPSSTTEEVALVSPFTGEKIPLSQAQSHIQRGLLDPKWIEQRDREIAEKRNEEAVYASGNLIEQNLRELAERRSDIFGASTEETQIGHKLNSSSMAERSAEEKLIWDGYQASAGAVLKRNIEKITPEDRLREVVKRKEEELAKEKIGATGAPDQKRARTEV